MGDGAELVGKPVSRQVKVITIEKMTDHTRLGNSAPGGEDHALFSLCTSLQSRPLRGARKHQTVGGPYMTDGSGFILETKLHGEEK